MRILVVEDTLDIAEALVTAFASVGIHCDTAGTLSDAELLVEQVDYRLVVLDLGLPDGDGMDLVKRLRARRSGLPVIVLTARADPASRINGLRAGADDYVIKPFLFDELHARVEAVLRRDSAYSGPEIRYGPVCIDTRTMEAVIADGRLRLSRREAEVLEPLVRRGGRVVSKRTLEGQLFGAGEDLGSNAIEVYVHRLRRKLEDAGTGLDIQTVRGIGYVLTGA